MACGTPVLAFAGGSVEEIIQDGVNGWICRDVSDMAERIVSTNVSAESCRTFAADHFSLERMIDRYLDIYDHAMTLASLSVSSSDSFVAPAAVHSGEALED
jgi:glycosyltransferase involved in cell wall biosynthesis